jgi:hypothetical protein
MVVVMVHFSKAPDLTGQTIGLLTVLRREGRKPYGGYAYLCRCQCGAEKVISSGSLGRKDGTRSCGCVNRAALTKRSTTHGLHRHPAYKSWASMIERCTKPTHLYFNRYGGRGISFCEAWRSFANFWADMGETWFAGSTIDRIDVDGNYDPGNCRWATRADQTRNRSNTVWISHSGKTQGIAAWSAELGLPATIIRNRLAKGLPVEEVLGPRKRQARKPAV